MLLETIIVLCYALIIKQYMQAKHAPTKYHFANTYRPIFKFEHLQLQTFENM